MRYDLKYFLDKHFQNEPIFHSKMLVLKNKLNNNLIIHLLESTMSQPLAHRPQNDICYIDYLDNQSLHEELLLYTKNRNKTIEEESQDQPFHLYITPNYKDEQVKCRNRVNTEEQTMELTARQEEPSKQLEQDRDTVRLKAIIDKKNRTIDEVTEQLKFLSEEVRRLKKMIKKQQHKNIRGEKERANSQIFYLQKNNLQLFEELQKSKKQRDALQKQLIHSKQLINQLSQSIKVLQAKNKQLIKQNDSLLKKTQDYLNDGYKEIKYLNKIKEIFYQKTGMQNFGALESCTQRINHKSKETSRMFSADVKNNKEKSVQHFLMDKSNITLKKDYKNIKNNRKSDNNATDTKYRQRGRGSLDLQKYPRSQRIRSKSSKMLYMQSIAHQL